MGDGAGRLLNRQTSSIGCASVTLPWTARRSRADGSRRASRSSTARYICLRRTPSPGVTAEEKKWNRIWHATSDDGIHFAFAPGNPVLGAKGEWSNGRAIDAEAYRHISEVAGFPVVASGGIATLDDLRALAKLGPDVVEGVITGRALYEGAFTLEEALEVISC